jgi:hypothetical protein
VVEGKRISPSIRVRRLPRRWVRRRYEVDFGDGSAPQITTTPVTLIDPILGVGDAWAVIGAADEGWTGGIGQWASLDRTGEGERGVAP